MQCALKTLVKLITKNGRILSTIYGIGIHYRVPVKLITKAGRTLSDKEERLLGSIHPVGTF